ncbi:Alpha/beta hydrolase family protein [Asanoa hainanensis]|uniref:Alpha/beta hydrolase family protein n=1 Tax=Asanoa hainanensis TaxID=560556 RepID=A0A239N3M5_9ACTN|nr:alpha/beta fold hydrolase [Asanoa hainanensis]SNT49546.1 Alpha/beta hydrolase family protein [Asanoa hainanensis]
MRAIPAGAKPSIVAVRAAARKPALLPPSLRTTKLSTSALWRSSQCRSSTTSTRGRVDFHQVPGPVLAVGHSYGGAAITNAAALADNVVGLVYVAAFAPDEGETLQQIEAGSRDSVLPTALRQSDYPVGPGGEVLGELSIDVDLFHEAFVADLPATLTAVTEVILKAAATVV